MKIAHNPLINKKIEIYWQESVLTPVHPGDIVIVSNKITNKIDRIAICFEDDLVTHSAVHYAIFDCESGDGFTQHRLDPKLCSTKVLSPLELTVILEVILSGIEIEIQLPSERREEKVHAQTRYYQKS